MQTERLEREFDLDLITTAPTVNYRITKTSGEVLEISNLNNFIIGGAMLCRHIIFVFYSWIQFIWYSICFVWR